MTLYLLAGAVVGYALFIFTNPVRASPKKRGLFATGRGVGEEKAERELEKSVAEAKEAERKPKPRVALHGAQAIE
jgi:hypothetical protein